ncbi:MAG: cation:proton antiporter [Erysipelotrichaceae bacterium]
MEQNMLLNSAILLLVGLLFGKLAKKLKLPSVTGYLIGGLLIGPYFFHVIPHGAIESLNFLSNIALGFIAFTIGSEFKLSYFKRVGFTPIVIALCEALLAVCLVTLALLAAGFEAPLAITLGAIAAATAPAATVMVIKQYKARGETTETLLSVVAIDDAVALIAFGFASAIASMMIQPETTSLWASLQAPLMEIVGSVAVGAVIGFVFTLLMKWFKDTSNRLILVVATILLSVGLAEMLHLSTLLLCMSMGAIFTNLSVDGEKMLHIADSFTPPLLMMFFVLSGAELNLAILPTIGTIGIIYILVRVVGKVGGAYLGASIMKTSPEVRKYLGWALVPQAGVAIGLSLVATQILPEYGATIRGVVLCATLVYEIVGPLIAKIALQKAGDIVITKEA